MISITLSSSSTENIPSVMESAQSECEQEMCTIKKQNLFSHEAAVRHHIIASS